MKHILFTLLLTLAWVPLADAQEVNTELYGDFRYSYNRADDGNTTRWASANNASRLGVRADVTGRGVTAFADLQTGVNIDADGAASALTPRYFLAGVRGSFGSVTVGRHSTAYKVSGLRVDPFFDTSSLSAGGAVPSTGLFAGATFGESNLTNGFAERVLAYTTPNLHGFTANAATYLDPESDHDYAVGIDYRGSGFEVGAQYFDANSARNWAQTAGTDYGLRGHAAYSLEGAWSVGMSYERLEAQSGGHQDFRYASGTVHLNERFMLAAAVGQVEEGGAVQPVTGTGLNTGVFYSLFPQASIHALYSRVDPDEGSSRANLALGFTYNFSLKP